MRKRSTKRESSFKPVDFSKLLDSEDVYTSYMVGNEYKQYGLSKGDLIFIQRTDELQENLLCAFMRAKDKTQFVAYAYDNFGEISILGAVIPRSEVGEVKMLGVVVGHMKPYDRRFDPVKDLRLEISVVCDKCHKTESDSPERIKAAGWDLAESERLCFDCYLKTN